MLSSNRLLKCQHHVQKFIVTNYSRRSNSKHADCFKVVGKSHPPKNDKQVNNLRLKDHPNWELLAPQGYHFYLPGSVGPAWHDASTCVNVYPQNFDFVDNSELECTVQECPLLLRKGTHELFPGIDLSVSNLTVVTLSQKRSKTRLNEADTEKLTKYFVLTAKEICSKLKKAGYWADFINPFSGLPYNGQNTRHNLYKTDERFRCLGFKISERQNCRLIEDKTNRSFFGNLFTTAPANTEHLKAILLRLGKN
ncbi:unnamed protein product [Bemisia tabaci]|uniref:Uncharacterized protein n=2 Tax=Bemisia tabaci TaxID=7038 RepID=A0A9P0EW93_BEMTA|nr:PREDICTED: methylmalonic aciduria and homocystinuria type D homolog, mitochondrial [Bemisia tabaci]CAH0381763.1 unnamed protein product [Bemisia tabaci]